MDRTAIDPRRRTELFQNVRRVVRQQRSTAMSTPTGDDPQIELDGELYTFVRYGDELLDGVSPYSTPCHICACAPGDLHGRRCPMGAGRPHHRPEHCRDCGVPIGSFHVGGCGVEDCPNCCRQFASCDCIETLDGVEVEYPDDGDDKDDRPNRHVDDVVGHNGRGEERT